MAERVYRSEAIFLRRSDLGEADRLITLATPKGRRRVIAKGVRKTSSRLAGHIELFTRATLLLANGRNLDIVTQSQTLEAYPQLHSQLERLSCAYYLAELYEKFTEEDDENRPLYELLARTLTTLDQTKNPDLALRSFELHLLNIVGYQPQFHYCVTCSAALDEQASQFSPSLGGMLCPTCATNDRAAIRLSLAAFKLLRYLQTRPLEAIETLNLTAEVRREALDALRAYLRNLLERDLRTTAFLDSLADPHQHDA